MLALLLEASHAPNCHRKACPIGTGTFGKQIRPEDLMRVQLGLARMLCLAFFLTGLTSVSAQTTPSVVKTPLGQIQGSSQGGVTTFKGIRYATAKRFEPPVPTTQWDGVKQAMTYGSNCPQAARFKLTEESLNEDCLFLNVTVPDDAGKSARLPVLVWIPGGAFIGGGSNLYDASRLARDGNMIVVTINYRVGLFGFMPHPAMDNASNGTLGFEDQLAALQWVKDNIAAFGGNPGNITVAGESAGSGSICQHLATPERASGLFHKAIMISGACLQQLPTVEQALAEAVWKTVSHNPNDPNRSFRCPVPGDADYSDKASLDCLKKVSVSDLLEAETFEAGNRLLSFVPVTGNQTVARSFREAVATGNIMKVPMIIGGAKDELRLYVAYDVLGDNATQTPYPVNLKNVTEYYLPAFYSKSPDLQKQILTRYFGDPANPQNLNGATLGSMMSDFNPHVGINNCFYLKTANRINGVAQMPPIYQFEFDDPNALVLGVGIAPGKNPGFALGAVHSAILNYLFPNFSNTAAINAPALARPSDKLAGQLIAYFSGFVHDGVPSAPGLPNWPPYNGSDGQPASDTVMLFQPGTLETYKAYGELDPMSRDAHQCAFWQSLFPN